MTTDMSLVPQSLPLTGPKQSLIAAISFMALAAITLMPHFILCAMFGGTGLAAIAVITVVALCLSSELAFALLVICLFLQNLFVAIVTPLVPGLDYFTPMLATSFINLTLTSLFAAAMWFSLRHKLPAENKSLMRALVLFFAIITVYTVIGSVRASLTDALTYMRVYLAGGFLLMTGIVFGFRLTSDYANNVLRALTFVLVLWGVVEFLFTYDLYSFFHIADYMRLKYSADMTASFFNVQQTIDFASRSYLNLSGSLGLDFDILRPMGPNIHPISYAYALAFGAIVCFVHRSPLLAVACLALLLLIGAKGPLMMAYVSLALGLFYQFTGNRPVLLMSLAVVLILYTVVGLIYGMYTNDYHVVGFMGGLHGFLSNPLGNGVGIGGNLSMKGGMTKFDFGFFQNYGASFALESGFGVMLYQIGIGTAIFLLFYGRLWANVWKAALHFSNQPQLVAIPCALAILLVNSVFQEEAFSPAGWGPIMLLSGLLLARYWRAVMPAAAVTAEADRPS